MALANQFTAEHDATDESASEDYHVVLDDFVAARLNYQQQAMRLGRLAVDLVQMYAKHNNTTVDEVAEQAKEPAQRPTTLN